MCYQILQQIAGWPIGPLVFKMQKSELLSGEQSAIGCSRIYFICIYYSNLLLRTNPYIRVSVLMMLSFTVVKSGEFSYHWRQAFISRCTYYYYRWDFIWLTDIIILSVCVSSYLFLLIVSDLLKYLSLEEHDWKKFIM